ncbi:MAG: hypothetical protein HYR72_20525 [Deltaproteobacteria bacterium]|nr:hypothetical protein [Deltaproteobacteria bacterium]MBI3389360.1 hypothetical protein [Deltaproteobacteria bacterium]
MPATEAISLDRLEARRDRTFRRLPRLRVQGARRALTFLNQAGLASLFATRALNLPSLWVAVCGRRDPQFPHHSHHDPEVSLAWRLKDALPAAGEVFYAKLIRGKPIFVAWDLFPAVYRLFGPQRDYVREYRDGLLSPAAKAVLDVLHREGPQDTLALKLAVNLARPGQRRTFDGALAELQQRLYVAMREVRYDPFTYVWDLVARRYPERVSEARRLKEDHAAAQVTRRYLEAVIYATFNDVVSVVGDRRRATRAIEALRSEAAVAIDCGIDGLPGKWLVRS